MARGDDDETVLVHGLWFGCWAMARVARGLRAAGQRTRCFAYPSTRGDLDQHAAALRRFARRSSVQTRNFVGHSLGGLVILRMLAEADEDPPGRVVLLGSPLRGSVVAQRTSRWPGSQLLLGESRAALDRGFDAVPAGHETGMIAGSRPVGLGWVAGGVGGPGDGTVAVAETRASGLADHCILPVSHSGLVLSREVIRQTVHFLQTGRFEASRAC
ncbi:MAG: alpha/beta fold hydrolase [Xanthomonadales bacterium]